MSGLSPRTFRQEGCPMRPMRLRFRRLHCTEQEGGSDASLSRRSDGWRAPRPALVYACITSQYAYICRGTRIVYNKQSCSHIACTEVLEVVACSHRRQENRKVIRAVGFERSACVRCGAYPTLWSTVRSQLLPRFQGSIQLSTKP
jgi:hypothetical protein